MALKPQDPNSTATWQHDWSAELASGETIASRQWSIDPDSDPTLLSNATAETVTVSGLTAGVVYKLSERVVTSAGNALERGFTIRCDDR
jgi:hypothetical protein